MTRWPLALATLLLFGAASLVHADYILIIANMGQNAKKPSGPQGDPYNPYNPYSPDGGGEGRGAPPGGYGSYGSYGSYGKTPSPDGVPSYPGGDYTPITLEQIDPQPLNVVAVVEVSRLSGVDAKYDNLDKRGGFLPVQHSWNGKVWLYTYDTLLKVEPLYKEKDKFWPTVAQRFQDEKKKRNEQNDEDLLKLADWALQHGLTKEFVQAMESLKKDNPKAVLFRKVQDALLNRPAADNKDVARWKDLLPPSKFKRYAPAKTHFTLLHNAGEDEAKARLKRLEEAYQRFYYWFALKGKELPMPQQRLLAVLVAEDKDFNFNRFHRLFDAPPLVADGFYSRRADLAFYSAARLDPLYDSLVSITQDIAGPNKRDGLLKSTKATLDEPRAHDQTVALLLKALEQEAEVASTSHETAHQLLTASGLLPRGVVAPEWVLFGTGSFFETPKGAPWPSYTGPNPIYLPQYKRWYKDDKGLDPAAELKNVITDRYFRLSEGGRNRAALLKARTMSWALTYYLAQNHLDGLLRYFEELSRLPRDLEFDEQVLKRCFGRAFGLMDPKDPDELSEQRVKDFAKNWHSSIKNTPLEEERLLEDIRKKEQQANTKKEGTAPKDGAGSGGRNPGTGIQ